jgi:ribosomal-protein-serine acetyltransferase
VLRHELPGGYALRLLGEADADELFALIDANRDHLRPWMPWASSERVDERHIDHVVYAMLAADWPAAGDGGG